MNNETELMDPVTPDQAFELIEQLRATEYNKMAKDSFESYRNYKNANEEECELIQDEWLEKWIDYTKHNAEFKGKEKSEQLKRVFKAWITSCGKWLDNASFSQLSLHKVDSEDVLVESVKQGLSYKDQQYNRAFLLAQTSDDHWYRHMRNYETKKCAKVHDNWNEQWKICWAKKCVDFEFNLDSNIDVDAKIFSEVHDIWEYYAHQSAWTDWIDQRSLTQQKFFEWSRAIKSIESSHFHMREMVQNEAIGVCNTNEKYQKLIKFLYNTPVGQIYSYIHGISRHVSNSIIERSDCIPISCETLMDKKDFLNLMKLNPGVRYLKINDPRGINALFEREFINIKLYLKPGYRNFDIVKDFISEFPFPYSGTFATQLFYEPKVREDTEDRKDIELWHSVVLFTRVVVNPRTLNTELVNFTILDQQQYIEKIRVIHDDAIYPYLDGYDSIIISVFGMTLYTYPKILNKYMISEDYRYRGNSEYSRGTERRYEEGRRSEPRAALQNRSRYRNRSRNRSTNRSRSRNRIGGFIASNKVLKYKTKKYKTKNIKK